MKKHLKRASYVFIIPIILSVIFFRVEQKTLYKAESLSKSSISKSLDFQTQIYPDYYTKIDLESVEKITEIFVNKGDEVKKDDVLIQLDDSSERKANQAAWSLYNQLIIYRNQIQEQQENTDVNLDKIEQNLNDTQVELEQLINSDEYSDLSEEEKLTITSELEKLIENLNLLLETSENTINTADWASSMQSAINTAYAQVELTQQLVDKRKITAPFDGEIIYIQTDKYVSDNNQSISDLASLDMDSLMSGISDPTSLIGGGLDLGTDSNSIDLRQENFVIVANPDKMMLYTDFSENEILEVKEGMNVNVLFENSNNRITGKIATVMNFPINEGSENPQYGVTISLDEIPEDYLIGSNVSGSIEIYQNSDILAVPISSVSFHDDKTAYVYQLDDNNNLVEKDVVLGKENLTQVEVIEGLQEGDKYVTEEEKTVNKIRLRQWVKNLIRIS